MVEPYGRSINYERLKDSWDFGTILAFSVATLLLGWAHDRFMARLVTGTLEGYLGLGALAASLFWLIDLRQATGRELSLFEDLHILERINRVDWQENATAIMVSLCFGGLMGAVIYPIAYCLIAIVIQIGDSIGVWMIQRAFFEVAQEPGLDRVLSEYYFHKPHFLHRLAKLTGFMIALTFAALARISKNPIYEVLCWVVAIGTIIAGESVLMAWRHWLKVRLLARQVPELMKVKLEGTEQAGSSEKP